MLRKDGAEIEIGQPSILVPGLLQQFDGLGQVFQGFPWLVELLVHTSQVVEGAEKLLGVAGAESAGFAPGLGHF